MGAPRRLGNPTISSSSAGGTWRDPCLDTRTGLVLTGHACATDSNPLVIEQRSSPEDKPPELAWRALHHFAELHAVIQRSTMGHAVAPKFGSWDAENIGYTVFFEKVRENKGPAPAPATAPKAPGGGGYDFDPYEHYENLSRNVPSRPPSSHGHGGHVPPPAVHKAPGGYDFDPYEHYENLSRNVPSRSPSSHGSGHDHGHAPAAAAVPKAPGGYNFDPNEHYENLSRNVPSRPASSHGSGHAPAPQHRGGSNGYHRRTGSNGSSAASEASSRGSKFSPPKPYQPRYSNNNSYYHHQAQKGAGGYAHGQYHHNGAPAAQRVASASPSPPRHHVPPPRRPKPSAVPRFGVWDEQNAAMAAQGFTVQFEKVKRHREEVKAAAAPPVPPQLSPDYAVAPERRYRQRKAKKSFMSKLYRCMFPVVRE
uniref:RIN4 pathogenic type III effector avirulence factor Avr cleavage site domain-containing protein n=1 Tax=Arundo donax TaxID=35708 RepID=A0A0A8ZF16_ARUDO